MSEPLVSQGAWRLAEATRVACVAAALEAYEAAAMSGLCHEGAWENAIGAMRRLDLQSVIDEALASSGP